MIQLRENYDWVVLGDQVGALFSAALVARLGLSVIILPLGKLSKTVISKEGDCLDPESNFLLGAGRQSDQAGLLSDCLLRIGVVPSEEEAIYSHGGSPQVLVPGARVALSLENKSFKRELTREFGDPVVSQLKLLEALEEAQAKCLEHWRALPSRLSFSVEQDRSKGLKEFRQNFYKLLKYSATQGFWANSKNRISESKVIGENPDLAQTFLGLWYGMTSHPTIDPSAPEFLQLLALFPTGTSFRGGMTAYRELLLRLAKRNGAEVVADSENLTQAAFSRLIVENGRLVAFEFKLGDGVRRIGLRGGALGCSLSRLQDKISFDRRSWLKRLKQAPTPTGWRFTIALQISADAIPPGMSSRMIWKEAGAPPLEMEMALPSDYGLRELGSGTYGLRSGVSEMSRAMGTPLSESAHRLIFLRTVMPYDRESLQLEFQKMMAARMVRQWVSLIPFSEGHIFRIFPDFRTDSFAEGMSSVYGFRDFSEIPENLFCYSEKGAGSSSGIEGLFLASDEAYPQLGGMGGCVAALEGVAWLAHRSGLSGPFA